MEKYPYVCESIYKKLNFIEKIIFCMCKKYTLKVYSIGVKDGYNWEE